MKKNYKTKFPVSIIVPMLNSSTTILKTLNSIIIQDYPIKEVIIVDNVSSDNSIELVEKYKKKQKKIPVLLFKNKKNIGVGGSYNRGVAISRSEHVIFMHSDSMLPGKYEIQRLVEPFYKDSNVVATYSTILHPKRVWNTYNFWMKCLMARVVGSNTGGLNDKFDCISKKIFKAVGGFDDKNYGQHQMIGAEDADLHFKLLEVGKVVGTKAKVIHLHYLKSDYALSDYLKNRKLLARSYGRLVRIQGRKLGPKGLLFAIIPGLAIIGFIPFFFPYNVILLFLFSFWYMKRMYLSRESRNNFRIFFLPFISILLIYLETYWMMSSLLIVRNKKR